ncbi:hypothetical protein EAI_08352 [Harpegnathos saltator]|uniref:Uncharacterized protein n=1 Tax=Harpegnathos saltator TaxID=610380 RepID=E2BJR4_HARSA|nr:hypothetical protein EAI_08352 [Harpegnathos saltator]
MAEYTKEGLNALGFGLRDRRGGSIVPAASSSSSSIGLDEKLGGDPLSEMVTAAVKACVGSSWPLALGLRRKIRRACRMALGVHIGRRDDYRSMPEYRKRMKAYGKRFGLSALQFIEVMEDRFSDPEKMNWLCPEEVYLPGDCSSDRDEGVPYWSNGEDVSVFKGRHRNYKKFKKWKKWAETPVESGESWPSLRPDGNLPFLLRERRQDGERLPHLPHSAVLAGVAEVSQPKRKRRRSLRVGRWFSGPSSTSEGLARDPSMDEEEEEVVVSFPLAKPQGNVGIVSDILDDRLIPEMPMGMDGNSGEYKQERMRAHLGEELTPLEVGAKSSFVVELTQWEFRMHQYLLELETIGVRLWEALRSMDALVSDKEILSGGWRKNWRLNPFLIVAVAAVGGKEGIVIEDGTDKKVGSKGTARGPLNSVTVLGTGLELEPLDSRRVVGKEEEEEEENVSEVFRRRRKHNGRNENWKRCSSMETWKEKGRKEARANDVRRPRNLTGHGGLCLRVLHGQEQVGSAASDSESSGSGSGLGLGQQKRKRRRFRKRSIRIRKAGSDSYDSIICPDCHGSGCNVVEWRRNWDYGDCRPDVPAVVDGFSRWERNRSVPSGDRWPATPVSCVVARPGVARLMGTGEGNSGSSSRCWSRSKVFEEVQYARTGCGKEEGSKRLGNGKGMDKDGIEHDSLPAYTRWETRRRWDMGSGIRQEVSGDSELMRCCWETGHRRVECKGKVVGGRTRDMGFLNEENKKKNRNRNRELWITDGATILGRGSRGGMCRESMDWELARNRNRKGHTTRSMSRSRLDREGNSGSSSRCWSRSKVFEEVQYARTGCGKEEGSKRLDNGKGKGMDKDGIEHGSLPAYTRWETRWVPDTGSLLDGIRAACGVIPLDFGSADLLG